MTKAKATTSGVEKKLRRRLQEAETAAIEARQELEAVQERLTKATTRLEKRQAALARARAALATAVSPPEPTRATPPAIPSAETAPVLEATPRTNGASEPDAAPVAPTTDLIGASDAAPDRPRRGRRVAAPATEPAAAPTEAEAAPPVEPDAPLGIIVP